MYSMSSSVGSSLDLLRPPAKLFPPLSFCGRQNAIVTIGHVRPGVKFRSGYISWISEVSPTSDFDRSKALVSALWREVKLKACAVIPIYIPVYNRVQITKTQKKKTFISLILPSHTHTPPLSISWLWSWSWLFEFGIILPYLFMLFPLFLKLSF